MSQNDKWLPPGGGFTFKWGAGEDSEPKTPSSEWEHGDRPESQSAWYREDIKNHNERTKLNSSKQKLLGSNSEEDRIWFEGWRGAGDEPAAGSPAGKRRAERQFSSMQNQTDQSLFKQLMNVSTQVETISLRLRMHQKNNHFPSGWGVDRGRNAWQTQTEMMLKAFYFVCLLCHICSVFIKHREENKVYPEEPTSLISHCIRTANPNQTDGSESLICYAEMDRTHIQIT